MLADSNHTELFYVELGSEHPSTIVLLHGLASSHFEFTETGIASSLATSYHVLVPDLPGHSGSLHCGPYTFDNIASKLASLVQRHAKNSRAHIFGFSGGGHAALAFAKHHPELVQTLIISGSTDQPSSVGYYTTYLAPAAGMAEKIVPHSLLLKIHKKIGFTMPEETSRECWKNQNWALLNTAWSSLREMKLPPRSEETYWQLPMRSLVIAGEKQDHVKGVQELGKALRRGNPESRAGKIPDVPHWWFLSRPQLLADIIIAWIEEKDLPKDIEYLDTA